MGKLASSIKICATCSSVTTPAAAALADLADRLLGDDKKDGWGGAANTGRGRDDGDDLGGS